MGEIQKRSSVDVKIYKKDETYLYIDAERSVLRDLSDRYKFLIKNHQFHPKVKFGLWDGYIRLFKLNEQTVYLGLLRDIINCCKQNNLTYEILFNITTLYDEDKINEVLNNYVEPEYTFDNGREYQKEAFIHGVKNIRSIMTSATASGKSMILFLLSVYYYMIGKNVIIIVPSSYLVEQMYNDFIEYFKGDKNEFASTIERIHSKVKSSESNKKGKIVITTWQSAKNKSEEWFDKFDVLLGDEVHEWEAKSLTDIIDNSKKIGIRHGFTGTLKDKDESNTDSMALMGMFGSIKSISKTYQLQKDGVLPDSMIHCYNLVYKDKSIKSKFFKNKKMPDGSLKRVPLSWDKECKELFNIDIRTKFIINIILSEKGNSLVMFNFKEEQGKYLYNELKKLSFNKEIFYIDGDVSVEERKKIIKYVEDNEDCILITSYGTFKRGVNVKNIMNLFFPVGFKSSTTTLQSIGRGLRSHKNKKSINVFDFGDNVTGSNYTYQHFKKRIELYKRERHSIKINSYELINGKFIKKLNGQ